MQNIRTFPHKAETTPFFSVQHVGATWSKSAMSSQKRSALQQNTNCLWTIAGFSFLVLIVVALVLKDLYSGTMTLLWCWRWGGDVAGLSTWREERSAERACSLHNFTPAPFSVTWVTATLRIVMEH